MVSRGSRRTGIIGEGPSNVVPPRGRGRGRGDGHTASSSATPSIQASTATGRGRGRGRARGGGAGGNPITEEAITDKMTQILQNTLPDMKEAMLEAKLKKQAEEEETERINTEIEGQEDTGASKEENTKVNNNGDDKVVVSAVKGKGCNFKDFSSTRPKEFKGIEGAVALMNWIKKMQSCFKICKCAEDQKVTYAATTLVDSALDWWDTECEIRGENEIASMSWEQMKKLMMEKYCTQSEVKKLESEFLRLEQGSSSVQEFVNSFLEKERFASYQVATEQRKIDRFKDGLRIEIKRYVDMNSPKTFVQAVEMEIVAEENNAKATMKRETIRENGKV